MLFHVGENWEVKLPPKNRQKKGQHMNTPHVKLQVAKQRKTTLDFRMRMTNGSLAQHPPSCGGWCRYGRLCRASTWHCSKNCCSSRNWSACWSCRTWGAVSAPPNGEFYTRVGCIRCQENLHGAKVNEAIIIRHTLELNNYIKWI